MSIKKLMTDSDKQKIVYMCIYKISGAIYKMKNFNYRINVPVSYELSSDNENGVH